MLSALRGHVGCFEVVLWRCGDATTEHRKSAKVCSLETGRCVLFSNWPQNDLPKTNCMPRLWLLERKGGGYDIHNVRYHVTNISGQDQDNTRARSQPARFWPPWHPHLAVIINLPRGTWETPTNVIVSDIRHGFMLLFVHAVFCCSQCHPSVWLRPHVLFRPPALGHAMSEENPLWVTCFRPVLLKEKKPTCHYGQDQASGPTVSFWRLGRAFDATTVPFRFLSRAPTDYNNSSQILYRDDSGFFITWSVPGQGLLCHEMRLLSRIPNLYLSSTYACMVLFGQPISWLWLYYVSETEPEWNDARQDCPRIASLRPSARGSGRHMLPQACWPRPGRPSREGAWHPAPCVRYWRTPHGAGSARPSPLRSKGELLAVGLGLSWQWCCHGPCPRWSRPSHSQNRCPCSGSWWDSPSCQGVNQAISTTPFHRATTQTMLLPGPSHFPELSPVQVPELGIGLWRVTPTCYGTKTCLRFTNAHAFVQDRHWHWNLHHLGQTGGQEGYHQALQTFEKARKIVITKQRRGSLESRREQIFWCWIQAGTGTGKVSQMLRFFHVSSTWPSKRLAAEQGKFRLEPWPLCDGSLDLWDGHGTKTGYLLQASWDARWKFMGLP